MSPTIVPSDSYVQHLSPPSLQPAPEHVKNLLIDYRITHILGVGGFARVYKAIGSFGKEVALKIPKTDDIMATMGMEVIEKFKAEAEIWMRLEHSNIVTLHRGKTEPLPHMAMELMEGGNLKHLMKNHDLTVGEAVHIIEQVLKGLSFAHRMASVHRDLKPENILFTADGVAKITDWGIGKFMASVGKSQSVGIKGTLDYCAPEQYDRREYGKIDWQTDIFQVGVMFYEMLTGTNPFEGEDFADCMGKVLRYSPEPPSSINSDVPDELDEVIMKAIEKKKEDRWESGAVMLNELQRFIRKEKYIRKKDEIEWVAPSLGKINICVKCGNSLKPGVNFCTKCGTPQKEGKTKKSECPNCGKRLKPSAVFCRGCGVRLIEANARIHKKQIREEGDSVIDLEDEDALRVTVVKMRYTQNDATKIAAKNLVTDSGKLFAKKIEVVEAALLKYLPLVQVSFDIEKKKGLFGIGGKEKEESNLYFHGMNGKMLQVTDTVAFSDIIQYKAISIRDFDGVAQFETFPKKMLPIGTEKPKIGKKYLTKKLMKMFGGVLKGTNTVYLPVFKFKITNKKTKISRILYVDSLFGIPTDENPFK